MKEYFLWLAKLLTVLVVLFFIPIFTIAVIITALISAGDTDLPKATKGEKQVAVVQLEGMIITSKEIVEELSKNVENKDIIGIVLRIDSPGGIVAPSQEIDQAVRRLSQKKPIVVSMGAVAASGGLYSAVGASKIYAQPGTMTGSIGVIMQYPNLSTIAEKVGFQMITVKSGALKDLANSWRPPGAEEIEFLQQTINENYQDFLDAVISGRKLDREKITPFADGRVILGRKAKEIGLVDELGDLHDAAVAVYQLAKVELPEDGNPKLHYTEDKYAEIKKILESAKSLVPSMHSGMQMMYLMQ